METPDAPAPRARKASKQAQVISMLHRMKAPGCLLLRLGASVGRRHGVLLIRLERVTVDPDRLKAAARDAQRHGTIVIVTSPDRQIAPGAHPLEETEIGGRAEQAMKHAVFQHLSWRGVRGMFAFHCTNGGNRSARPAPLPGSNTAAEAIVATATGLARRRAA
jgi:hypothetical protein